MDERIGLVAATERPRIKPEQFRNSDVAVSGLGGWVSAAPRN